MRILSPGTTTADSGLAWLVPIFFCLGLGSLAYILSNYAGLHPIGHLDFFAAMYWVKQRYRSRLEAPVLFASNPESFICE